LSKAVAKDSLAEETTQRLEIPERRSLRTALSAPVPLVLAALLIAAAGFIAGALIQKNSDGSGGSGQLAGPAGLRAGGGPPALASAAGAGAPTTGTVSSVVGNKLYVTDAEGNTVKVIVQPSSTVTRSAAAKASAIHPGDTVIVQGAKKKNGTVTAQSVNASEKGSAPGGGLFSAPGGAAGGTSATSGGGGAGGAVNSLFKSP
jgi:hypothetical protein